MENEMNAKKLIAAFAAFAAAGSVFAQTGEFIEQPKAVSTKTRAEVRAELEQAYNAGQLAGTGEASYPVDYTYATAYAANKARQEALAAKARQANGFSAGN
jgi:hypothetical protein